VPFIWPSIKENYVFRRKWNKGRKRQGNERGKINKEKDGLMIDE
jgi:hypothetical protein